MREVVGSFIELKNVDSVIRRERKIHPRWRQVVNVLLIIPTGRALCLCVAEGAIKDQRLNLSPIQGGIEVDEQLNDAAKREVDEEVSVGLAGDVVYLGSVLRILPPDHRHAIEFDKCHHHWVAAFSASYHLQPQPPQAVARWHYFDTLEDAAQTPMSTAKATMFNAARAKLVSVSDNTYLIDHKRFGLSVAQAA